MFDDIRPIRTLEDHDRAMAEVERLWGSPDGTPDGDRLEVLAELIQAFEKRHYKRGPPDPIEAIKFRMDQQGLTRKDLEPMLGSRARCRNSQPQARPVPANDPPLA